ARPTASQESDIAFLKRRCRYHDDLLRSVPRERRVMAHTPSTAKGRNTRARILSAARQVFGRDGYVGTTMSAVASEADMSLGGLYRYFRDKEDLFAALI